MLLELNKSRMLHKHSAFLLMPLLLVVSLLASCTHLLFYPGKHKPLHEETSQFQTEKIRFDVEHNVALDGLLVRSSSINSMGAVLFLHGNSGDIGSNLHHVLWLADCGYDVLMVDYRGYGLSEGSPNLSENLSDIAYVLAWFNERYHKAERRVLMAHSLGASMSAYVLADQPQLRSKLNGIILIGGFSAYRTIMRDAMEKSFWISWLRYPMALGMPEDYDPIKLIDRLSPTPLMIIHGIADPVVPYRHGQRLFERAANPKVLVSYVGLHNDALEDEERRRWVLEFMRNNTQAHLE